MDDTYAKITKKVAFVVAVAMSSPPHKSSPRFSTQVGSASTRYNPRFNLLMGSSRSFGSTTNDNSPYSDSVSLGFGPEGLNQAADGNSPDHYAKGTPSHLSDDNSAPTACRHMVSGSFPPLAGVLPIFRSPYSFTIGRQRVFSLTRWSPQIQSGFHVTRPTQVPFGRRSAVAYGAVTRYGPPFQLFC